MTYGTTARQGNGQNSNVNVNTRMFMSYSDTACVTVGLWNKQISVRVQPLTGVDANGIRQYEQNDVNILKTSIGLDNSVLLLEGINKVVIPAYEAKKPGSVSVTISAGTSKKLFTIGTDGTKTYMTISVNVGDDNKATAENTLTHEFATKVYYKDMDAASGTAEPIDVQLDFLHFKNVLEMITEAQGVDAHAAEYWKKSRSASGFGGNTNTNTGFNGGGHNGFQSQQLGGVPAYQAPTATANQFAEFIEQS